MKQRYEMATCVYMVVTMQTGFAGSCVFASFPHTYEPYQWLGGPDILPLLSICHEQFML